MKTLGIFFNISFQWLFDKIIIIIFILYIKYIFRSNNQYYHAYNVYYSADEKENYEKKKKKTTIFCIFLVIIGTFFQIIRVISWSDHNKSAALQRSAEIQMEHEQNMKIFENKTFEEKVQILDKLVKNYNISVDDP